MMLLLRKNFSSEKSIGVANGDLMTKNNNQSLKIKNGYKVPKNREHWLGCNVQGQKILTDVKSVDQFQPWDILTREAHSPGLK